MSGRDQMLCCSTCSQPFIGEPEPIGLDFCSDKCSNEFWEEQRLKGQEAEKEKGQDAENV